MTSIFQSTFNSPSPHREAVTEILQLLEDAKIITPENKQQAISIAGNYLADNSDFISIVWCVEDVLHVAAEHKPKLSKDQALEVLKLLDTNHDACLGICWETVWQVIDEYIDYFQSK